MSPKHVLARILPVATLAAMPMLAAAQTTVVSAPQRVEIRSVHGADAPRRDVTSVCPSIQRELPEALASAWRQVGQEGTVRVHFTLDGNRIVDVASVSGPRHYRQWIRSAMQDVSCQTDRQPTQAFQFDIRFVDTYGMPEPRTVALLTQ
jgi:hypothetical protein